jgi:GT2 family glycosyltransferase
MSRPRLSAVIVAHNSLAELRSMVPALLVEVGSEDEVIIVDSGSGDGLAAELAGFAPAARLLTAPGNVGFAAGANLGIAHAHGDLMVLLNPDAIVEPGWAGAIRAPWGGEWAGWMGLVTMDAGTRVNTSGGILHFTGLGWAGQVGEPLGAAPREPTEVDFLSGACLAIPRSTWDEVGGFPEQFFMYCEDVDLSLRLRLGGGRLAVVPEARVIHDYDFDKGAIKWRLLERNRWATVLRTYPAPLLAVVFPALLATEAAIWAVSVRGGWARMKALATLDVIRSLPRLARERRAIQAARQVDARTFAAGLTSELGSPYFGRAGSHPLLAWALRVYWQTALALLR